MNVKYLITGIVMAAQVVVPNMAVAGGGCNKFFSRKIISHAVCAPEIIHQQACPQPPEVNNIFYPVGMLPTYGQQPLQQAQYTQMEYQMQRLQDLFAQYAPPQQPQQLAYQPPAQYPPQYQPAPQASYYPPPQQSQPLQQPQQPYYPPAQATPQEPYYPPQQPQAPPQYQTAPQEPYHPPQQPQQSYYPPAQQGSPCETGSCPEPLPVPPVQQQPQPQQPYDQYQAPAQQYPPQEQYVQRAPQVNHAQHRPGAVPPPVGDPRLHGTVMGAACLRCHNQGKQEGGLNLTNVLAMSVQERENIYAKVASGEMPPRSRGRQLTPPELYNLRVFDLRLPPLLAAGAAVGR